MGKHEKEGGKVTMKKRKVVIQTVEVLAGAVNTRKKRWIRLSHRGLHTKRQSSWRGGGALEADKLGGLARIGRGKTKERKKTLPFDRFGCRTTIGLSRKWGLGGGGDARSEWR